ncbi:MAG: response regulator [Ignavibacteriaceae bacterium]|nr:response regulator [Ignavibacteriaceae bacterium]
MQTDNLSSPKTDANTNQSDRRPVILVVDDEKKILEAFEIFLAAENCEMISASDVDEALVKTEGVKLDLIITDFYLKTKSSIELYTLIKKSNPGVPIAVITGYPEYISEEDVKIFGADYFFTKPLELDKLRILIRECCPRK